MELATYCDRHSLRTKFVMAEFGAHLNQGTNAEKPTIFEVVAQESMNSVLRPALTYCFKVLASSRPDNFGCLWRYSDELYTLIDLLIQNHYLKKFQGTFSENFYGLKRYFATRNVAERLRQSGNIGQRERFHSLLSVVFLPYCKLKLDNVFEKLREENLNNLSSHHPVHETYFQKMKSMFIYLYPILNLTWEFIFLSYQMGFMLKMTDFHSPLMHLCGLRLKRLSRQDTIGHSLQSTLSFTKPFSSWKQILRELPRVLTSTLITVVANGIPLVVFFIKFLDWWYSSENSKSFIAVTTLPIPQPPEQLKVILG